MLLRPSGVLWSAAVAVRRLGISCEESRRSTTRAAGGGRWWGGGWGTDDGRPMAFDGWKIRAAECGPRGVSLDRARAVCVGSACRRAGVGGGEILSVATSGGLLAAALQHWRFGAASDVVDDAATAKVLTP